MGKGYQAYGGIPGKQYYLGLDVIPMGDHNAVDVAQEVHWAVLVKFGALPLGCELVYGEPFPQGQCELMPASRLLHHMLEAS